MINPRFIFMIFTFSCASSFIFSQQFPAFLPRELSYVLYMDLGGDSFLGYIDEKIVACKNGSNISYGNRVYTRPDISEAEIFQIKQFYGNIPFVWFVNEKDTALYNKLANNAFIHNHTFFLMDLDITSLSEKKYSSEFSIKHVATELEKEYWIDIMATVYVKTKENAHYFLNFVLSNSAQSNVKLYLGYYNEKAVAISMAIEHDDIVSLHLVGVLPEFRKQGFGYAISYQPLLDAHKNGFSKAVLLSSAMGKSVYEKIGFKEIDRYKVYGS